MANVISPSFEQHPSPYPWCKVRKEPAVGQKLVMWKNVDGGPVPPEWRPRNTLRALYSYEDDYAPFNPDISFVSGGAPCLSAAARELIEVLEPGMHQFFPVDIFNEDDTIREPRRYILNVCSVVDAIVEGRYSVLNNGERLYHVSSLHPAKIRRDTVSGLHLWRDKRAGQNSLFISGQLRRKIDESGFSAFDLGVAEEL